VKKEYLIVLCLIAVVSTIGLIVANNQRDLEVSYPSEDTVLQDNDYTISVNGQEVTVGSASWEDTVKVFAGETLGMSTVYRPDEYNCCLTFSKHANKLIRIHINTNQIATNRGARVGDTFATVEKLYGPNYSKVWEKGKPQHFDAAYGVDTNHSVVFKVRSNLVETIVIQSVTSH